MKKKINFAASCFYDFQLFHAYFTIWINLISYNTYVGLFPLILRIILQLTEVNFIIKFSHSARS